MTDLVQANNLDVRYGHARGHWSHQLSTSRTVGATAVIGPNGSGKSTLLSAIAGLVPVSVGIAAGPRVRAKPRCARPDQLRPAVHSGPAQHAQSAFGRRWGSAVTRSLDCCGGSGPRTARRWTRRCRTWGSPTWPTGRYTAVRRAAAAGLRGAGPRASPRCPAAGRALDRARSGVRQDDRSAHPRPALRRLQRRADHARPRRGAGGGLGHPGESEGPRLRPAGSWCAPGTTLRSRSAWAPCTSGRAS